MSKKTDPTQGTSRRESKKSARRGTSRSDIEQLIQRGLELRRRVHEEMEPVLNVRETELRLLLR